MVDPFLLLMPILILAIMALVRFVGCVFVKPAPVAPHLDNPVSGDQKVFLSWEAEAYYHFDGYNIKRGMTSGGPYSLIANLPGGTHTASYFDSTGLVNGTTYFYVVTGHVSGGGGGVFGDPSESNPSNEVQAIPEADVTVTFDNDALGGPPPGAPGSPLVGLYKNLNFETTDSGWIWVDTVLGMGPKNAANINSGANPGQADISLANGPRFLQKITVFPKAAGNVTITDTGNGSSTPNLPVTHNYGAADLNVVQPIQIAWTLKTPRFTIAADAGFNLNIDEIVYTGPP